MKRQERALLDRLEKKVDNLEQVRDVIEPQAFGVDERESTGELTVFDQHPADVADFAFQRELSDTQGRILQQEANQVREAIERVKAGQYGICADCDSPIGDERMKARPEATLCIDCQTRREARR